MAEAIAAEFDQDEIAVVTGGPATGADFSGLAFDHLLFTGATSVAKHVMRAASENLVPVTLELGGKSPVVIGRSADMAPTTDALMAGKMLNAGQICFVTGLRLCARGAYGRVRGIHQEFGEKDVSNSGRQPGLHIGGKRAAF